MSIRYLKVSHLKISIKRTIMTNEKKTIEICEKGIQKKKWDQPKIKILDISKTEGGRAILYTEDSAYHIESQ